LLTRPSNIPPNIRRIVPKIVIPQAPFHLNLSGESQWYVDLAAILVRVVIDSALAKGIGIPTPDDCLVLVGHSSRCIELVAMNVIGVLAPYGAVADFVPCVDMGHGLAVEPEVFSCSDALVVAVKEGLAKQLAVLVVVIDKGSGNKAVVNGLRGATGCCCGAGSVVVSDSDAALAAAIVSVACEDNATS